MIAADEKEGAEAPRRRPRGRPYRNVPDAKSAGMLGVGMIIGAVLGAGIALLLAPQAGRETRRSLARRAGSLGRGAGAWRSLGRELRKAAKAKRRSLEMEAKLHEAQAKRAAKAEPV